ncbi:MAG: M48 family metalloprotease [Chloroflexota bacterium]
MVWFYKNKATTVVFAISLLILISPLIFLGTGIGQEAIHLSDEVRIASDGSLQSSPKAVALHQLSVPIRISRLLSYPILLLLLQYSGLAVLMRIRVYEGAVVPIANQRWFQEIDGYLHRLTRSRLSLSTLIEISVCITIIFILISIIFFPLSLYRGFILRHQFGLSTQSFLAWLRDFGVRQLIGWLTTLVTYGGFYCVLKLMPRQWPIWGGVGFTVLFIGFFLLQPIVVTPLFYQVTPLADPDLQQRIDIMANRVGVTIDDVSIIDASSKTTTINAYVTGFAGATKIVLWDTLLIKHPPDEVDVVLAHEMAHWYYRHTLVFVLFAISGTWLGLFALRFWLNAVWKRLGWRGPDDVAGYPYLLAVIALVSLLSLPVMNGISRLAENQADQFAIDVSQKPVATKRLFERFAEENLGMIEVPAWEKFIFRTHPPLIERIQRAERAIERDNLKK